MMRQSRRTRLGKRRRIEAAGEAVEVVPEAEDEVASEAVDVDVVEGGVSNWKAGIEAWSDRTWNWGTVCREGLA